MGDDIETIEHYPSWRWQHQFGHLHCGFGYIPKPFFSAFVIWAGRRYWQIFTHIRPHFATWRPRYIPNAEFCEIKET